MFDFTTTTFIHDADMIEINPVGNGNNSSKDMLRLENKLFKYEDVVAIYRNPYIAPMNAKLKINITNFYTAVAADNDIKNAKRFKLDFYLKRSGDNNSFYSNDFVFKGKDFHYEWTNKQNTAEKISKMINKIIRLYGDVYLKVSYEGDNLIFENDNYGWFTEVQLKAYVPEISDCCTYHEGGWVTVDELTEFDCYEGENTCDTSKQPVWKSEKEFIHAYQGVNGFGTYEELLKDLRLPTMENFRWTSLNESEMPIPGNKYTQYTIHQISCRGVLGGSAVGEVTHSKTTHVFFVPACGCGAGLDDALLQAIKDIGWNKKLITVTGVRSGEGGIQGGIINDDPTHDPATIEKFEHDPSKKASTVNKPATNSSTDSEETNP